MAHTFSKDIRIKVNIIMRLKFELTNNDITTQHMSHCSTLNMLFVAMETNVLRQFTIKKKKDKDLKSNIWFTLCIPGGSR